MGTLVEKLEHTKTQADKIKEVCANFLPIDASNVTTLEECCDALIDHAYKQEWIRAAERGLSYQYWVDNGYASKDVENAITLNTRGIEYTVTNRSWPLSYRGANGLFIFPDFTYHIGYWCNKTATYSWIFTMTNFAAPQDGDLLKGTVYDFSRLQAKTDNNVDAVVEIRMVTTTCDNPVFVALPDRASLVTGYGSTPYLINSGYGAKPGTESTILGYGFSIGEYLDGMTANTINQTLVGRGEKLVTVMPGYYGKDLYLSKIEMSAETMVNIFNNLATITAGYTINVGSDNLAKLTDEQIAIATEKGWVIT